MDAATTTRLARLDNLRTQRGSLSRAITSTLDEIREKRRLVDTLSTAPDVLTERFNHEREAMVADRPHAEVDPAVPPAEPIAAVPPPFLAPGPSASIKLFIPGREPLHVAVPDGQEERAETLLLGFMMLHPARA